MEAQTITTNGTGSTPPSSTLPPGARVIAVARPQATALRALVSELKQLQTSLEWLAEQVASASHADVTGLKWAGVQDENGQMNLVYVPDESTER